MCEGCGLKPEAYVKRHWCYDCKPGNFGRPLPCRRCGSTGDYWAGRLCRRCHPFAPQLPDSCRDCLAWGVTRLHNWTCQACLSWRFRNPTVGECISCHRNLAINEHHACRLCWMQTLYNQAMYGLPRDVVAANRGGQQLWLADTRGYRNGYRPHRRRDYNRKPDQLKLPSEEPAPERPINPDPDQPSLFDYDPIEDPARGYGYGEPPNTGLAIRLDRHAVDAAQRHGWSERQTRDTRIALRVLQAKHRIQAGPITHSQVHSLVADQLRIRLVQAVLDDNQLFHDDRTPTIEAWFDRQLVGLPQPMTDELRTWFTILRHGSSTPPRSHPRQPVTIKTRLTWAIPTLRDWAAAGHHSLREISRSHIDAVLPGEGNPRAKLGAALRSIFTTLKRHRVLFINPMAGISVGNVERRTPLPVDTHQLRALFNSHDPATGAITALIAIHGLRPGEACALQLADVRDHRIHLPDRTIPLAPATKARLDAYLADRRQRWPGSINPHFLVHSRSATTLEPVMVPWLTHKTGFTASRLRQDRILVEVTAGGDHRRICDFFGVTITTADHYVGTLNHPDLDEFVSEPSSSRTRPRH